jgi:hypothetical protein
MPGSNVLVVFWSRFGATEKLALAAAVGAVQAHANIRLRWLKEENWDPVVPGWPGFRARMESEYIQPRAADIEWAQGIVLASPDHVGSSAVEWVRFFALGDVRGKRLGLVGDARLWPGASVWIASTGTGVVVGAQDIGRKVALGAGPGGYDQTLQLTGV